jgi:hypothetical protein
MNDFDDLLGDQPDVPDWPGLVHSAVRRKQRKRWAVTSLAVTSLLVLGGAGAVFATGGGHGHRDVVAIATSAPTPDVEPTVEPTDEPKPTPTPLATATPEPSPTVGATTDPTPTASPEPTHPPAGQPQTVTVTLLDAPATAEAGDDITVKVRVTWSAAAVGSYLYCSGCGDPTLSVGCALGPTQPAYTEPQAGSRVDTITHRLPLAGDMTITISASSGPCPTYYTGSDVVQLHVLVSPKPTPTPTATTSPEPSATPSPEPSPSPSESPAP